MSVIAHKEHKRKADNTPYIVHPIAVLSLLIRWEADEDTCIAGILHDVLEDAPEDRKEEYRKQIEKEFGPKALAIVEDVSEQDKTLPWIERKKQYLEHLKTASEESLLVSCADLTHNLYSLMDSYREQGEEVWKHFNASKQWKVWFIDQRVEILKERLERKYTQELVLYLSEFARLLSYPLTPECPSRPINDSKNSAKFIMDPLYQKLWNHCKPDKVTIKVACNACSNKAATIELDFDNGILFIDSFMDTTNAVLSLSKLEQIQYLLKEKDLIQLRRFDLEDFCFICGQCNEAYCRDCWSIYLTFDDGFYDETRGRCPKGHQQMLMD